MLDCLLKSTLDTACKPKPDIHNEITRTKQVRSHDSQQMMITARKIMSIIYQSFAVDDTLFDICNLRRLTDLHDDNYHDKEMVKFYDDWTYAETNNCILLSDQAKCTMLTAELMKSKKLEIHLLGFLDKDPKAREYTELKRIWKKVMANQKFRQDIERETALSKKERDSRDKPNATAASAKAIAKADKAAVVAAAGLGEIGCVVAVVVDVLKTCMAHKHNMRTVLKWLPVTSSSCHCWLLMLLMQLMQLLMLEYV